MCARREKRSIKSFFPPDWSQHLLNEEPLLPIIPPVPMGTQEGETDGERHRTRAHVHMVFFSGREVLAGLGEDALVRRERTLDG